MNSFNVIATWGGIMHLRISIVTSTLTELLFGLIGFGGGTLWKSCTFVGLPEDTPTTHIKK
jgi:hypothetical protein